MNIISLVFLFCVILCMGASYLFYYYKYGKLARYFLVNLYRFPSSYILMIITYGFRPFLKEIIHAVFYEEWILQLYFLSGVEVIMMITILTFEIVSDNHKSRLILILELMYSGSLVSMNILLLFKHEYVAHD